MPTETMLGSSNVKVT